MLSRIIQLFKAKTATPANDDSFIIYIVDQHLILFDCNKIQMQVCFWSVPSRCYRKVESEEKNSWCLISKNGNAINCYQNQKKCMNSCRWRRVFILTAYCSYSTLHPQWGENIMGKRKISYWWTSSNMFRSLMREYGGIVVVNFGRLTLRCS